MLQQDIPRVGGAVLRHGTIGGGSVALGFRMGMGVQTISKMPTKPQGHELIIFHIHCASVL